MADFDADAVDDRDDYEEEEELDLDPVADPVADPAADAPFDADLPATPGRVIRFADDRHLAGVPSARDLAERARPEEVARVRAAIAARAPVYFLPATDDELSVSPGGRRGAPSAQRYVLFGRLSSGERAQVIVRNIPVFFDVQVPRDDEPHKFEAYVRETLSIEGMPPAEIKRVEARSFLGSDDPFTYLELHYRTSTARKKAIEFLRDRFVLASDDVGRTHTRRISRLLGIPPAVWIRLENYHHRANAGREAAADRPPGASPPKLSLESDAEPEDHACPQADHVFLVDPPSLRVEGTILEGLRIQQDGAAGVDHTIAEMDKHTRMVEANPNMTKTPHLCLSWDLETISGKGTGEVPLPNSPLDEMFMCGMTFGTETEAAIQLAIAITTKDCPPVAGVTVIVCENERALIEAFFAVIARTCPDIEIGFNTSGYDWEWMVERALTNGILAKCFDSVTALPRYKPSADQDVYRWNYTKKQRKLGAGMAITTRFLNIPGLLHVDILNEFRVLYPKMEDRSLKSLLAFLKLPNKIDLPYTEMWRRFRSGTPAEFARVAEYCVVDCLGAHRLMQKRQILAGAREIAAMTFMSLYHVFHYAISGKILNMVLAFAERMGYRASSRFRDVDENAEKYAGALVIEPKKGINSDYPISVPDFGSLYPSLQMADNICPTSLIKTEARAEVLRARGVPIREVFSRRAGDAGAAGAPRKRVGRFAWHGNDPRKMAVVPMLLYLIRTVRFKLKERKERMEGEIEGLTIKKQDHGPEFEKMVFVFSCLDARQAGLKLLMNSSYGFMGMGQSPMYELEVAVSITTSGVNHIMLACDACVARGYTITYGDTDSAFIKNSPAAYRDIDERQRSGELQREAVAAGRAELAELEGAIAALDAPAGAADSADAKLKLCARLKDLRGYLTDPDEMGRVYYFECLINRAFELDEAVVVAINEEIAKHNGTQFLTMDLEKVLFPMIQLGNKKYLGGKHVSRANVRNLKLLIKGIDYIKRQYSTFVRDTGAQIVRDIFAPVKHGYPPKEPLDVIKDTIASKIEARGAITMDSLVMRDDWRPHKQNLAMHKFVARMTRARDEVLRGNELRAEAGAEPLPVVHYIPEPGERIEYLIVKQEEFTLTGRVNRPTKGERMEYLRVVRDPRHGAALAPDIGWYFIQHLVGICARLINYRFPGADKLAQNEAKKMMKKFMEGLIRGCSDEEYRKRGYAYKRAYRSACQTYAAKCGAREARAAETLSELSFQDIESVISNLEAFGREVFANRLAPVMDAAIRAAAAAGTATAFAGEFAHTAKDRNTVGFRMMRDADKMRLSARQALVGMREELAGVIEAVTADLTGIVERGREAEHAGGAIGGRAGPPAPPPAEFTRPAPDKMEKLNRAMLDIIAAEVVIAEVNYMREKLQAAKLKKHNVPMTPSRPAITQLTNDAMRNFRGSD